MTIKSRKPDAPRVPLERGVSRIEWIQIPEEAKSDRPAAAPDAAKAVRARACERCGWLNPLEDPACFRCGHAARGGTPASKELQGLGVSMPPMEVVAEDGLSTRFRLSKLDPEVFFGLRLKAERLLLSRGLEELQSWPTWNLELYEHQRRAVKKALSMMRGRAILADEVGLGKTIEAGVAMRELMARGLVRSVLVLAPAALLSQWKEELQTKFGLPFQIATKPETFEQEPLVIGSLSLARGPRVRNSVLDREWDLLVVDEAHKLRRRSTLTYRLVNAIRKKYVLLLTATPIQNDLTELYSLSNVLKPGLLGTIRSFKKYYVGDAAARTPKNPKRLRSILQEIMIRNRRATVGIDFPARRAAIVHLELGAEEREIYDRVTRYVREEFRGEVDQHYQALSLVTLQRELCSSSVAVKETLRRMASRPNYPPVTREQLGVFVKMLETVPRDTKINALAAILDTHPGKFLVYTDFLATQRYIADELAKQGVESVLYHGGLTAEQRVEAIHQFESPRVRVMISTGAGAEGLNLQFCHQLVNYDLPWNPMRVEQRIGRVHRLGQEHDVLIFNLSVEDTVEERVMELLAHKIRLFEIIVGELDQILGRMEAGGSLEQQIADIYLGARSETDAKKKFKKLGTEIESARKEFFKVKRSASQLLDTLHESEPGVAEEAS